MGTTAHLTLDPTNARLHEQNAELRRRPAVRVALRDGFTAWAVTEGATVKRLLTDPRLSRDAHRHWPGFDPATAAGWLLPWTAPSLFNSYGEDHTRLRRLVAKAFTVRSIEAMRPRITAIAEARLAALAAAPGDVVDLRALYSYPIPITVICDLFGVPEDRRAVMGRLIDTSIDTTSSAETADANAQVIVDECLALLEYKRANPGDDLLTRLLGTHGEDGDTLTAEELVATIILFVGAGSETTVSLIDHAVVNLLAQPDALAAVLAEPARWSDVIEETLRHDGPVGYLPLRYAVEDVELGDGVTIAAGDTIIIGFAAHGRDPSVHTDPDTWNLDRADTEHLAFGHGVHFCMGAPLARLEARIALDALFRRFPELSPAVPQDELRRSPTFMGNDFAAIPVRRTRAG